MCFFIFSERLNIHEHHKVYVQKLYALMWEKAHNQPKKVHLFIHRAIYSKFVNICVGVFAGGPHQRHIH